MSVGEKNVFPWESDTGITYRQALILASATGLLSNAEQMSAIFKDAKNVGVSYMVAMSACIVAQADAIIAQLDKEEKE